MDHLFSVFLNMMIQLFHRELLAMVANTCQVVLNMEC
jgi:hypothetical protein